jgi:hypothetical protein
MKKTSKYALLTASVLAVAASAQAYSNGDLLIGFTGGSSDFIYDLGNVSLLSQGESWTIGSSLGAQFGVVGALNSGSQIFATSSDSAENAYNYSTAFFNLDKANIGTIAGTLTAGQSRTTTPADTTGWTYMTAEPPGTPGNTLQNNMFNPNVDVGLTAYFFDNNASGPTPDGSFTYDTANGVLTYSAVPEPATFGLLGGFGLLALAFRRHLIKA